MGSPGAALAGVCASGGPGTRLLPGPGPQRATLALGPGRGEQGSLGPATLKGTPN